MPGRSQMSDLQQNSALHFMVEFPFVGVVSLKLEVPVVVFYAVTACPGEVEQLLSSRYRRS